MAEQIATPQREISIASLGPLSARSARSAIGRMRAARRRESPQCCPTRRLAHRRKWAVALDIIDDARTAHAAKTGTTGRVCAATKASPSHLLAVSTVDCRPRTSGSWITVGGCRQLPFLQQQQLRQLWWFMRSATKQCRSIDENSSFGAQPNMPPASSKMTATHFGLLSTCVITSRFCVASYRRPTCCPVRKSAKSASSSPLSVVRCPRQRVRYNQLAFPLFCRRILMMG